MKTYKIITINECNFFFISDGKDIVLLEPVKYSENRYRVSSVHIPDRTVGTGYILAENAELTADTVENFLHVLLPNWADRSDLQHIKKYKDLDAFIAYESKFHKDIKVSDITLQ